MTRIYRLNGEVKPLIDNICGIDILSLVTDSFGYEAIDELENIASDVDVAIVFNSNVAVTDIADILEFSEEIDESIITNFGCIVVNGDLEFLSQADFDEVYDVEDVRSMNKLCEDIRLSIIEKHLSNGVKFESFDEVYIDDSVEIEAGAYIGRNVKLMAGTKIAEGAVVGSGSVLQNAVIGKNVDIQSSRLVDCTIGDKTTVGPYANIHTGSVIAEECRIGNFVEIKNSKLGFNTKSAHLAYIGDTDIGYKCNIGCGAIFVNYDGENKHRSVVGNGVFVGSNSNVVAPVTLEDGAYIAAGSTVTCDLPSNCMCIARSRETIKPNRTKYHKLDK